MVGIKRGIIASVLLLAMMHGAMAEGALAIGSTGNVVKDGIAMGFANNWRTSEKAKAEALRQCRENKAPKATARCQIVATYRRECVSTIVDPKAGTPGVGWAVGPDAQTAKDRAVAACKATAGKNRAQFCTQEKSSCDVNDDKD